MGKLAEEVLASAIPSVDRALNRRLDLVPEGLRGRLRAVLQRPGRLLAGKSTFWVDLALASAIAVEGRWRPAVNVAVASELTAAALEVLDDVEDGDLTPTDPLLADGYPRLINASTGLLTLALDILPGRSGRRLRQAVVLAHAGQEIDLALTGQVIAEEQVVEIAQQKTAQLLATVAWLGARAAGASDALADQIGAVGQRLGLMGQWQNDLNALRPRHSSSDFLERKPSILVVASGPTGPDVTITEARQQAVRSGAAAYVWLLAETQRQEALELVAELERAGHPVDALRSLVRW